MPPSRWKSFTLSFIARIEFIMWVLYSYYLLLSRRNSHRSRQYLPKEFIPMFKRPFSSIVLTITSTNSIAVCVIILPTGRAALSGFVCKQIIPRKAPLRLFSPPRRGRNPSAADELCFFSRKYFTLTMRYEESECFDKERGRLSPSGDLA